MLEEYYLKQTGMTERGLEKGRVHEDYILDLHCLVSPSDHKLPEKGIP